MTVDPARAHRRLLRAGDQLSPEALASRKTVFRTNDPTAELSAGTRRHERLHRGPQPRRHTDRARRVRLPEPGQRRKAHHAAHRSAPGRVNHQRSRSTPLTFQEPPTRHARATTGTLRSQLINIPGRLARSARRLVLHVPQHRPWQQPSTQLVASATGPPAAASR